MGKWQTADGSVYARASAEEKKAEAARKKAERDALLAEEEKALPSRAAPKNAKTAVKKTKGIDQAFSDLDSGPLTDLNATGIDNALDALGLTDAKSELKIDRHPERRMGKGYEAWMERIGNKREEELRGSVRQSTRKDILWKEFLASPENPKNQVTAEHNATREELRDIQAAEKKKVEDRLGAK